MERGKATVSRHATLLGLNWDRTQTAAATDAKVKDAAERSPARLYSMLRRCSRCARDSTPIASSHA